MNKHPLADCDNCTLKDEKYVPSSGPEKSDLVMVGEAPGYFEVKEGAPFVGASGKLLNVVLQEHGINRDTTFLTNTVLCRPPENRTPTKSEILCCSKRLQSEIESRSPTTIVALGGTASSAITGQPIKITTFRAGPPKESKLYPGVRVIPTFHPAACLRSSDSFPSLVADIGKVDNVSIPRVAWEAPKFRIFDSEADSVRALQELLRVYDEFVIDIETGAEKESGFEHADHNRLLCIGIGYRRGSAIVIGESAIQSSKVRYLLGEVLRRKIIAHNGKFDLAGLSGIHRGILYFDTMLASYVMDERAGVHGLKYLANELLGAPRYDDEIQKFIRGKDHDFSKIPRDILYKYNAYDVACTWLLYEHYTNQFDKENWKLHNFLVDASNELMYLEMGGVKIDEAYLKYLEANYEADLDKRQDTLFRWVDNPRSPKQVKEALSELGTIVDSTNEETLTKLTEDAEGSLLEFCSLMLEYRKEHKLYSTYVTGLKKRLHNGRVYPTFLLHGTTTGRLSCRNSNLQNIPRGSAIRRLFVPDEGNVFIQADYSQAELRTVAALAKDSYLQGVFNEGRDIHSEVARRFFGDDFSSEQRVKAKMVVFGLTYAMTPHGLARRMNIPLPEAQRYQREFFSVIPDVVNWREEIKHHLLKRQDDLVTPFGRHRRYWLITEENREDIVKEGTAFLPQSIASDICLSALISIRKGLANEADVRLPVHDSIMVECERSKAKEISEYMRREMEEAGRKFTDFVKYAVDIKTSDKSWGDLT